ncbi:MAG: sel1 repeat family protein [Alphaproteobacteria bacterium]|nr:sel1 repeat family protein [Alphaproteobacteria bacterium]
MRLLFIIFILCTVLCLMPSMVFAGDPTHLSISSPKTPSLEEYKNIPQGVLLPNVYTLLKKKNTVFSNNGSVNITKALTLEEIFKAYHKGSYDLVAKYLIPLSESGSHQVEELLGIMYLNGQGVQKDAKYAYSWFSKAAEVGRPLAEHYLGILTFTGIEVPPPQIGIQADPVKALMWLNIAILHYPNGYEKKRAIKDRDNISASLTRRDRSRAIELTKSRLYDKGEKLLFDLEMKK